MAGLEDSMPPDCCRNRSEWHDCSIIIAMSLPNCWSIKEDNGLRTFRADGTEVRFPYKKVDEVLLALALAGEALDRDRLAEKLWTSSSIADRRTNLRKALSHLRKSIGEHNLISDRYTCRLREGFVIGVHEDLRRSHLSSIEISKKEDSPVVGFEKTLLWLSKENPVQMLRTMRASHDLLGAVSTDLTSVLLARGESSVQHDPSLLGWVLFWQSNMVFNAAERKRIANKALRWAVKEKDKELVVSCTSSLVSGQMTSGQMKEAFANISAARKFVGLQNPLLVSRLDSLLGVVMLHAGRAKDGLALMQPNPTMGALLDSVLTLALKALYVADIGEGSRALEIMEYPRRIAEESGHFTGTMLCDLTLATAVAEEDSELALEIFTRLLSRTGLDSRLDLIVREAAGANHYRLGNRREAAQLIGDAARARRRLGYVFTSWDQLRLQKIPRDQLSAFQAEG